MKRLLPFFLLPLTALAAGEPLPYACDNGSQINVSFLTSSDGRPQAILHFSDGDLTLPQVPTALGALYRADDIQLHTQGEEAIFTDGKGNLRRCTQGTTPPPQAGTTPPPQAATKPSAVSSFLDITGRVTYREPIALPADAVLIIRVQDIVRAGAPARQLAEQRIELGDRPMPFPFATTIDRDLIGKKSRITVTARIERRGKLLYVSDKAYPALSNGQPLDVNMQLKRVARGPAR